MTDVLSRGVAAKLLLLGALVALGGVASGGTASAKGAGEGAIVEIVISPKGKPQFVPLADPVVAQGEDLTIVNETNPRQIGPHTFSLVDAPAIPKDQAERRHCFDNGNICREIAAWQGLRGDRITINPVEAGAAGWDTQGNLRETGDSWYTETKGESFTQPVSGRVNKSIHFMCAVHPNMRGRLKVESPTAG
jgi:hypothetical protein